MNGCSMIFYEVLNIVRFIMVDCIEIFLEICFGLGYVYCRGYLYNDIKVNNVVFERLLSIEKYSFVFIDFGKSIKVIVVLVL